MANMFELLREKKTGQTMAKIILALLIIPFALFGVDYYRRGAGGDDIATVGGHRISPQEYDQALRERQDRLRGMLGDNFDPAMMENPEVRRSILEDLINQYALVERAKDTGLTVSDADLAALIAQIEVFQRDGKFSRERYEMALRNQGMTTLSFEQKLRQQILAKQAEDPFAQASFVPRAELDRMIALGEQEREVSVAQITPEQFLSQIKLDPAAAKTYYEANKAEFEVPEQVRLEYIVLSPDTLTKDVQVSSDEVKKYYEDHQREFGQAEERRASHILINAPATASEAERKAARAKAEELAKQAKQSPDKFAELAKQNSQDPGSAANGGDLGFFARGAMVKPFDDAVFAMKQDEISGPVESDFGFHVIKLTGIKPSKLVPLDEATPRIEQEIKKQKAAKKFAEVAENFSNLVFEQGDSLKPAADALKLPIQQSGFIRRKGGSPQFPAVNEKMLAAVFSEEVLKNKRNTEAIEVAPNTLVSARVLEYKPAALRPFEEVSGEIEKKLQLKQAAELAARQGKEALEKLQQGGEAAGVSFGAPLRVSRQKPAGLPEAGVRPVFQANASKLPQYVGLENPRGGYTLVKIIRVLEPPAPTDAQRRLYGDQLRQLAAQEQLSAYLASSREREGVKIRTEMLEKKAQ
jgi:peptidyl-prolyl cis-trans isomerase D